MDEINTERMQAYKRTRDALDFLYEEAIRNQSFDMAKILLQALGGCEQLIDKGYKPDLPSDAISCLNLVKEAVAIDGNRTRRLSDILSLIDAELLKSAD